MNDIDEFNSIELQAACGQLIVAGAIMEVLVENEPNMESVPSKWVAFITKHNKKSIHIAVFRDSWNRGQEVVKSRILVGYYLGVFA